MSKKLTKDKCGRYEVYFAVWHNDVGASSTGIFSRLEPAIFFVVSGLGSRVSWSNLPDDEWGDGIKALNPVFVIDRVSPSGRVFGGKVMKMLVADYWTVGNGGIPYDVDLLKQVAGIEAVVSGSGSNLQAKVG